MSKWLAVILGLVLSLAAGCGTKKPVPDLYSLYPGKAPICRGSDAVPPELAKQPGYHELTISVGRHVDGAPALSQDDLQMFQGKNRIPIKYFQQETASVGILVDTSGSMESKLQQAQNAITEFIKDLNPQDDVFLFAFSSEPFLLQPLTTNHQLVIQRLSLLHAYGQTALLDTNIMGLLTVRHGWSKKKALFLITDGMDNTSRAAKNEVIDQAQAQQVPIYSIGVGNPNPNQSLWSVALGVGEIDAVDTQILQALSSGTGAKTYLISEVGDGKALTADAQAIAAAIGDHYIVGYIASGANQSDIRLEVRNRNDLKVNVESVSITAVSSAAPSAH